MDPKLILLALGAFVISVQGSPAKISLQVDDKFWCYAGNKLIGTGTRWGVRNTLNVDNILKTPFVSCVSENGHSQAAMVFSTSPGVVSDADTPCYGFENVDAAKKFREANPSYPPPDTKATTQVRCLFGGKNEGNRCPWGGNPNDIQLSGARWVWPKHDIVNANNPSIAPNGHSAVCYIKLAPRLPATIELQVDNKFECYAGDAKIGGGTNWGKPEKLNVPDATLTPFASCVLQNAGGPAAMVFSTSTGVVSDENTVCYSGFDNLAKANDFRKNNPSGPPDELECGILKNTREFCTYQDKVDWSIGCPWGSRSNVIKSSGAQWVWGDYPITNEEKPYNVPDGHVSVCYIKLLGD